MELLDNFTKYQHQAHVNEYSAPQKLQYSNSAFVSSTQPEARAVRKDPSVGQPLSIRTDFPEYSRHPFRQDERLMATPEEHQYTLPSRSRNTAFREVNNFGTLRAEPIQNQHNPLSTSSSQNRTPKSSTLPVQNQGKLPFAAHMKEFIIGEKFEPREANQLSVFPGETVWVNTVFNNLQSKWIWVYSPRLDHEGYIPTDVIPSLH